METRQTISAQDVINDYDTRPLEDIFVRYGELTKKQTNLLVEGIKRNRPITTTTELAEIARSIPHNRRKKIEAQVFQGSKSTTSSASWKVHCLFGRNYWRRKEE
jgi:16S rRNA C1402 N4-methylase RsmH